MAYIPRKGVKRKYLEEEVDDISRCRQRQRIIDMSMGKLRSTPCRHGDPDPCLRRSVLILNTLKQIEAELQLEGVESHQSAEAAKNEIPEMSTSQLTLDPLPDMSTFMYPLPSSSPIPMSVDSVTSEGGDFAARNSSVVDLMPAKPIVSCSQQALSQASSSVFFTAPSVGSALSPSHTDYYGASASLSATASPTLCFDQTSITSQTFYDSALTVNSVLELLKMFGDGDSNNNSAAKGPYSSYMFSESTLESLTLAEADPCHMDTQGSMQGASSSTLATVRSHETETSECASPGPHRLPQTAVLTNTQCSTYCRSDSTLDDLDSIMQILVGM